jgi:hypothetical protein
MLSTSARKSMQKTATVLLALAAAGTIAAFTQKGKFADHKDILPGLLNDPVQRSTRRQRFHFKYRGKTYIVRPVAEYELWGLVASRNNPRSIMDAYHDWTSVDTRDLGIIWGKNLRNNDFHRVKIRNSSWQVHWRYPHGVTFYNDSISNNHLITGDPAVRSAIGRVQRGDQIHMKGMLVNYRSGDEPGSWRRSSTSRTDTGNGACEVVYVESIEVLKAATPEWYLVYRIGWWAVLALLGVKVVLFIASLRAVD